MEEIPQLGKFVRPAAAGLLHTLTSPMVAFIYLAAWRTCALTMLLRAIPPDATPSRGWAVRVRVRP